ncbi:MAG: precorrin-4 C(11)-methyltransferase [Desulfomonilaceae bacterium]
MKVYFVGAGPGDPELLTVKAYNLLRTCRFVIYAGSLISSEALDLVPSDAEKHDSAKLDLEEIKQLFLEAKRRDVDVVRLHSGDPSIYGAIREQMNILDDLEIEYTVIPGVSSFQAAAAVLRTELTVPEHSQTIILTRTSGRTPMPARQELEILGQSRATLCIFLSAHKLEPVAATLSKHYGPQCPAAVVYKASWPDQIVVTGTLADISSKAAAAGITKTAMIIVGEALSRNVPPSKLYDPTFTHKYRLGKES